MPNVVTQVQRKAGPIKPDGGRRREMIPWKYARTFHRKGVLPFFFVALFFGAAPSSGVETVIVNKTFHGREIKIRAGGLIRIHLEQLGSAGYTWEVQELDKEHFELVGVHTESTPSMGDVTGTPVVKTWLIRAKKAGKGEVKFLHRRPWEDEKEATERFCLRVRILGTKN